MDYHNQVYHAFWQGLVRLVVLHQASLGPIYSGRLSKFLRDQGYAISSGSRYPLLHLLEKAGFLASRLKVYRARVRKYYEITPQGRACLAEVWWEVADLVREVILEEDAGAPSPSSGPPLYALLPESPKIFWPPTF
jgi:PadR family transcriptional regulator, regulatory protein PadR